VQDGLYKKLVQRQMAGKHSRSTDSIAACSDADVQSAAS